MCQLLESRQLDWCDSFISRARQIGATQKVQIKKKCFTGFISQIMIVKKGQNRNEFLYGGTLGEITQES
jgi:hypothetical protein